MFKTQFAETKTLAGQHSNSCLPCTAAIGSGVARIRRDSELDTSTRQ